MTKNHWWLSESVDDSLIEKQLSLFVDKIFGLVSDLPREEKLMYLTNFINELRRKVKSEI